MAITIQMIEEKEFKTKVRGYDPEEVDEFLDEIVDEMEAMQNEIRELRSRAATQPTAAVRPAPVQIAPVQATAAPSYQEDNLRNILVTAQRVSDEAIADAQKRSQEMLDKARSQAEGIVTGARNEAQQLMDEMDTLKAAASDYRARFQRLVDDQTHILKAETELFRDR